MSCFSLTLCRELRELCETQNGTSNSMAPNTLDQLKMISCGAFMVCSLAFSVA